VNKVAELLKDRRFDDYQKLIEKKEQNMAESMYISKNESEARVKSLIKEFNSGMEIQPLSDDAVLFTYAQNRVATLRKVDGDPALYLANFQTKEELMLDISFYIPKGKTDFEII